MSYPGRSHIHMTDIDDNKSTVNMREDNLHRKNHADHESTNDICSHKSKSKYRSRSRSYDKYSSDSRRYRDKYRSRGKYSPSTRSYSSRYKSSRSRSRSPNRDNAEKRSKYHSKSDSRSRRHRHSSSSSERSIDRNEKSRIDSDIANSGDYANAPPPPTITELDNTEEQTEENSELGATSVFKNDGSFLEMFKKIHGQGGPSSTQEQKKPAMPLIGRRRGGKVLKTGIVEKPKPAEQDDQGNKTKDPWSIYIDEVKKYRQSSCQDEGKTRSLVK